MREEAELYESVCPLDEYLTIGSGHGQYKILMGIGESNYESIFLVCFDDDTCIFMNDSLEGFIEENLYSNNDLKE